jgi:hypothetical protein
MPAQDWNGRNFFCVHSLCLVHIITVGSHWGPVIPTSARIGSLRQGDSQTLTVVGSHWGPVIPTSARIGSPGPGRFTDSHCGWVPLRPSDSDFGQNWKPETGRFTDSHCGWVPLRPSDSDFSQNWKPETGRFTDSHHCGWVPLRLSDSDFGQNWKPETGRFTDSHCGWVPLMRPSDSDFGQNWKPETGRFTDSHCGWAPLRPSDSDFCQNWKPRTGEIHRLSLWLGAIEIQWFRLQPELEARDWEIPLLFSNDPKGSFRCMNHMQSTHHSAFDKPVKLHWWTCGDEVMGTILRYWSVSKWSLMWVDYPVLSRKFFCH